MTVCTIESCAEEATKAVLMNRHPAPLRPTSGVGKYHKAVPCCDGHYDLLVRMGFPSDDNPEEDA